MEYSIESKVDLVHSQLKRAKERVDMADVDLHRDLLTAYNSSTNSSIDPAILQRLAEKLQLTTVSDLKQESLALHEMVVASDGDPGEIIEKMSSLLKKIKDFMLTHHLEMGRPTKKTPQPSNESSKPPILPDDFRCPVSLELMKDPVIVSTGQVSICLVFEFIYFRSFILEFVCFPPVSNHADLRSGVDRAMDRGRARHMPKDTTKVIQQILDPQLCFTQSHSAMV